jgi:hypothetical protein
MSRLRFIAAAPLLLILLLAAQAQEAKSAEFASAEQKIHWIGENGLSEHPSTKPTVLTAAEWNAYLNQGGVQLPDGVTAVRLATQPAIIRGDAEVDFDRLTANRTRNNPLLQLFTGKHHVTASAHASASHGIASIQVDAVQFDGVEIPRIALEYFAGRYLRPKFGNAIGLDSTFRLKNRIETAIVGADQVTITQR